MTQQNIVKITGNADFGFQIDGSAPSCNAKSYITSSLDRTISKVYIDKIPGQVIIEKYNYGFKYIGTYYYSYKTFLLRYLVLLLYDVYTINNF